MTVVVAVSDTPEGVAALEAAVVEAEHLRTDLVVVNLGPRALSRALLPTTVTCAVVERGGRDDREPVEAVLEELASRPAVDRLVIGLRRRTPVGKLMLGSVSQGLLLRSPVPVLAVKTPLPER